MEVPDEVHKGDSFTIKVTADNGDPSSIAVLLVPAEPLGGGTWVLGTRPVGDQIPVLLPDDVSKWVFFS